MPRNIIEFSDSATQIDTSLPISEQFISSDELARLEKFVQEPAQDLPFYLLPLPLCFEDLVDNLVGASDNLSQPTTVEHILNDIDTIQVAAFVFDFRLFIQQNTFKDISTNPELLNLDTTRTLLLMVYHLLNDYAETNGLDHNVSSYRLGISLQVQDPPTHEGFDYAKLSFQPVNP